MSKKHVQSDGGHSNTKGIQAALHDSTHNSIHTDANYGDSSAGIWSVYVAESDKYDRGLIEAWKDDTNGIIIFTGLFSATVATFTVASYIFLQPSPSDTTNALLSQILVQLSTEATEVSAVAVLSSPNNAYTPGAPALRVNVLWFISLVLSLTCALAATLIQQWIRAYKSAAEHSTVPYRRGHIHAFVFEGLRRFHVSTTLEIVPMLLHSSVFLFFGGLIEFLLMVDATVAYTLTIVVTAVILCYVTLTILPIFYVDCPFRTPFTRLAWRLLQLLHLLRVGLTRFIMICTVRFFILVFSSKSPWRVCDVQKISFDNYFERLIAGMEKCQEMDASRNIEAAIGIDCRALQRTLVLLDHEEGAEPFVKGIPGLLHSLEVLDPNTVVVYLLDQRLLVSRISTLLHSCVTARTIPVEDARRRRALACFRAVWNLTERLGSLWLNRWFSIQGDLRTYTYLREDRDLTIAVNALCTTALAAHGFIRALIEDTLKPAFPDMHHVTEDIVDIVTTLIGPSLLLKEECLTRESIVANGPIVNLITFILRLVPFLQTEALSEADLALAWDTLCILSAVKCDDASFETQVALLRLCTVEMSDLWDDEVTLDMDETMLLSSDEFLGISANDDITRIADVLFPICATLPSEVHDQIRLEQSSRPNSPSVCMPTDSKEDNFVEG